MERAHEPVSPQPGEGEEHCHHCSPFGFRQAASLATDAGGRISEANMAALRLLNIGPERLLGRPFSTLVPPQHRSFCRHFIRRVRRSGEAASWTLLIQPHQRPAVPVDLAVVPVRGRTTGMVTSLRWVLQEKRRRSRQRLNQKLDAVSQGLSGIRWSLDAAGSQVRVINSDPERVSYIADVIYQSQKFLVEAQRSLHRLSR